MVGDGDDGFFVGNADGDLVNGFFVGEEVDGLDEGFLVEIEEVGDLVISRSVGEAVAGEVDVLQTSTLVNWNMHSIVLAHLGTFKHLVFK